MLIKRSQLNPSTLRGQADRPLAAPNHVRIRNVNTYVSALPKMSRMDSYIGCVCHHSGGGEMD